MATAASVVTEMMILIPESSKGEASGTMLEELRMLDDRGVPLSKELCDVLWEHMDVVTGELIKYLDSRV